jgi:hypothetical protein
LTRAQGGEPSRLESSAWVRSGRDLGSLHVSVPETLRALYQRYCDHEAEELLSLLPREGLRALLRKVREGERPPEDEALSTAKALEGLRAEARALLPLPPYEVWLRDYVVARVEYLDRMGISTAPERSGPVTVAVRSFGDVWWAHLNLERKEGEWRGHLSFHAETEALFLREDGERALGSTEIRTADIFRGRSPEEIRSRFREFTPEALDDFLRSVTPGGA